MAATLLRSQAGRRGLLGTPCGEGARKMVANSCRSRGLKLPFRVDRGGTTPWDGKKENDIGAPLRAAPYEAILLSAENDPSCDE